MASLPADRTKLALAQGNQVPNLVIASAKNINAITEVYDTVDLLNQKVDTNYGTGAIGTNQLATDAVTLAKMANASVGTNELVDASVTAAKIATGTITSTQIADLSIATADLADALITTAKLADLNVTTGKLADAAVTLAKMAAASVGTSQLVDGSVTDAKIAGGTITADKFVAGALNNDTQNGLLITALQADITQREINIMHPPSGYVAAVGNNIADDAPAIQAIVDYLYSLGGGKVFIPKGTFRLKTRQGTQQVYIRPRSNVHIVGNGDDSILIADDGVNTSSTFNVIRHVSDDTYSSISNVEFRNFKIDCNGLNNLVPNGSPNKDNVAIGIWQGNNILVDRVTVVNNAGRQCFSFGDNTSPHSISNLRITNCYVYKVATDITGNIYQTDHSVIYAQSDGFICKHNIIANENLNSIATAIENHSSNSIIEGNIVTNFNNFSNVVATITDNINTKYVHNVANNVNIGFMFWSAVGYTMDNILIANNTIVQSGGTAAIFDMASDVNNLIGKVTIQNNHIESILAVSANTNAAFTIGRIQDLIIKSNQFINILGRAIQLGTIAANETSLYIENNQFFDCNRTSNASYKSCLSINAAAASVMNYIKIARNLFKNTSTQYMTYAINSNAVMTQMDIEDNTIVNLPNEITWAYNAAIGQFNVRHQGSASPYNVVLASMNSTWLDKTTGYLYTVKKIGLGLTGWRKVYYDTAAPTTGTHHELDEVVFNAPVAGGYKGWVCVTAGTPGTWQGYGEVNLQGSLVWDPASSVDGTGETSAAITVTGAALGDFVCVSAPYDLQGIICSGYVSATNTVKIRIQNETGGTIDLASGTWKVKVIKQ